MLADVPPPGLTPGAATPGVPVRLEDWEACLWIVLGIAASFVLPLAIRFLKQARHDAGLEGAVPESVRREAARLWAEHKKKVTYAALLAVCMVVVASAIVYMFGMEFLKRRDAIFAGFAWQSILNQLINTPGGGGGGGGQPADPKKTGDGKPADNDKKANGNEGGAG